jgi:Trypsin
MPHHERRAAGFWITMGALLVSMGCAAQAPVDHAADVEPDSPTRPGTWPRDTQFFMLNSREDTENRYLSTLIVESEGSPYAFCSGVLLEPNIVLTAGHCVCVTSQAADSADGAKRAEGLATARTRREAVGLSASSAEARRMARTPCSRASTHTSIG